MQIDTFLPKQPIKPYHIISNTLTYSEEIKRAKNMSLNTNMDGVLRLDNKELESLISSGVLDIQQVSN